jgi:hypothetical protein
MRGQAAGSQGFTALPREGGGSLGEWRKQTLERESVYSGAWVAEIGRSPYCDRESSAKDSLYRPLL